MNEIRLKPKDIYETFELYEMLIEDLCTRQGDLICKEIYKSYIDVKDLTTGDKNVFYIGNRW